MMPLKYNSVRRDGLALITVLSLMALIIVLLVGLLTLTTTDQAAATQSRSKVEAQANAKLAMAMAIGQLQEYVGPDQRVSAEAAILEDPASVTPMANPHWVGVWRTDGLKVDPDVGATPLIRRNTAPNGDDAGSLIDRRDPSSYDRKNEVMDWLVSRSAQTPGLPDPVAVLAANQSVVLVGQGSVSEVTDQVRAGRVEVMRNGETKGGYAFWVGDEGGKARFNLADARSGFGVQQPWTSPAQSGIDVIAGFDGYESVPATNILKVNSRRTADVSGTFASAADARDARMRHFHNLSFHSSGLLTDTANGGLRRDLSAYFQGGNVPALGARSGLSDTTPILDSPKLRDLSPKFGLLRHWNNLTTTGGGSISGVDPVAPDALANATSWGWTSTQNYRGSGVNLMKQEKAPIHPIMVDVGISYAITLSAVQGAEVGGKKPYRFNIHYFPRVVLWNPYNVKINTSDYVVHMHMPHKFDIKVDGVAQKYEMFETGYHDRVANLPHRPYFSIPSVEFEPGEALLFTADTGGASRHWGEPGSASAGKLSHFTLSCKTSAPFVDNFYVRSAHTAPIMLEEAKVKGNRYRYQVEAKSDYVYKRYAYKLYLNQGGNGNVSGIDTSPGSYAPLQFIDQTEDGGTGSNALRMAPVAASQMNPLKLLANVAGPLPYHRFKWGHRVQWLDETAENMSTEGVYSAPYSDYNTIGNHNMRAGWHVRSPVEVAFRASNGSWRYNHGMLIDDPHGWKWEDSTLNPVPVGGKNRVSPFGRPADFNGQTFPMMDLPTEEAPLLSMGAIQHAPLSQFAWHPMYAVGNSLADPRVRRDRTTNYVTESEWRPIGIHNSGADRWQPMRQGHANPSLNSQAFLYDLSYESNHALWDRYFLSAIDGSYTAGTELDNPRIVVAGSTSAPVNDLRNYHLAAKHLMIDGAFNVNSTNENAWAALLASFRAEPDMMIETADGGKVKGDDIYARLLRPYDLKYDNEGAYDEKMWKGYRQLTDDQIRELAREIVVEVKQRGPFISLADFVNRRLVEPPSSSGSETALTQVGLKGALQTAIDRTDINSKHHSLYAIPKTEYHMGGANVGQQIRYGSQYPEVTPPTAGSQKRFGAKPDHNHWADTKLVGAPSYLTQADVLQKLGSVLSSRSDTFVIRTYGDTVDAQGAVIARAWCEAVVQRIQEPIEPDDEGINPHPDVTTKPLAAFGRKFKVVSFRWLDESEI